jgi:hypothetical protein
VPLGQALAPSKTGTGGSSITASHCSWTHGEQASLYIYLRTPTVPFASRIFSSTLTALNLVVSRLWRGRLPASGARAKDMIRGTRKVGANPGIACASPLYPRFLGVLFIMRRPQSESWPLIYRRPRCHYQFSQMRSSYALVRLTCTTARIQERSAGKIFGRAGDTDMGFPLPPVLSGSVAYPRPRSNRSRVRPSLAHVAEMHAQFSSYVLIGYPDWASP